MKDTRNRVRVLEAGEEAERAVRQYRAQVSSTKRWVVGMVVSVVSMQAAGLAVLLLRGG